MRLKIPSSEKRVILSYFSVMVAERRGYTPWMGAEPNSIKRRDPLSVAHKDVIGGRRAAWCASVKQKEMTKAVNVPMISEKQAPMNQKEGKTVEVPQIQYQEVNRHVTVPKVVTQEVVRQVYVPQPYLEHVNVPRASIIVQMTQKTMEVPQVQVVDLPVVMQCRIPATQAVQKAVEVPQVQFLDRMDGIPETVSQDRIPQRTAEQITDAPVPQVTGELVEDFNVFSQSLVQQRIVEPIAETPAVSLANEIVEAPEAQTQEKRNHRS